MWFFRVISWGFLFLFFFLDDLRGQINLVPNPSFEEIINCPTQSWQIHYAPPWKSPTDNTPDFFHGCQGLIGPPNVVFSGQSLYQNPHSGVGFSGGFFIAFGGNNRDYISTILTQHLLPGVKYYVEFYVSLANASIYAIENIGLYFDSSSTPYYPTLFNLPFQPQIVNSPGRFLSDTLNWMKISGIYEARGDEKSIIIGNFNPDSLTNFEMVNSAGGLGSYYLIDDVYVGEYIPKPEPEFSLSPNPGNGDIVFNYHLGLHESAVFRLYNSIGQLVAVKGIDTQTGTVQFQFPYLQSGVYYWQVISGDEVLGADKMVVAR